MRRVGIGLVGCGLFGESHLQAFRAVPGSEVRALLDVDRDRAERLAARFGVPRVCATVDEFCGLPDVDLVDVVTPETAHVEPVQTAFAAGKHVFVEKPMAADPRECDRMIEASRAAGRFLMVGHILRFETRHAMLKEELAAGRLGRVVSLHARRNRPRHQLAQYGRVHPALISSIHDIDLMLWYVGEPVRRVRGYARHATGGKHPDTFWGVIEFEGGAIGVVESIWMLPKAPGIVLDDAFELVGTAGVAKLDLIPASLSYWRDDGFEAPDVGYDPRVMGAARGALREELAYICDCVAADRAPTLNTGAEGRRAVRVATALIESAESDRDVAIDEQE